MAKRKSKKKFFMILLFVLLLVTVGVVGYCNQRRIKEKNVSKEVENSSMEKDNEEEKVLEKGYNLPVDNSEKEEAENDCKKVMEVIADLYKGAEKGESSNVVLSDQTIMEMLEKIKEMGYPVMDEQVYSDIENYEVVDDFLQKCIDGKSGAIPIYQIRSDGGIGRSKFIFNGKDMYVLAASAVWNQENKPGIVYISYTRIKEWDYTEEGCFCFELCVPEPPEVTEIVDGSCMIKVKPMNDE